MYRIRKLNDYLPPVIGDIEEIKRINNAAQLEILVLWRAIERLQKEFSISTATGEGLKRWESALGIPNDTSTLAERRLRIRSALQDPGMYTMLTLRRSLDTLCGKDGYTLNFDGASMTIKVSLSTRKMLASVRAFAERVVPANIVLDVDLAYNTHEMLSGYTHAQLSGFTHKALRENVFENQAGYNEIYIKFKFKKA